MNHPLPAYPLLTRAGESRCRLRRPQPIHLRGPLRPPIDGVRVSADWRQRPAAASYPQRWPPRLPSDSACSPASVWAMRTSAMACSRLPLEEGRELRLITFSAGTAFGELGLLDQEPRSATGTAIGALLCYVLTRTDFVALTRMYPAVAIKLLCAISGASSAIGCVGPMAPCSSSIADRDMRPF